MTAINTNPIEAHYDIRIDENNDLVHDPQPLKVYMDKWDGTIVYYKKEVKL